MNKRTGFRSLAKSKDLKSVIKVVESAYDDMRSLVLDSVATGMSDILDNLKEEMSSKISKINDLEEAEDFMNECDTNLLKEVQKVHEEAKEYLIEVVGREFNSMAKSLKYTAERGIKDLSKKVDQLED